jgi:hypothetical protein
MALTWSSTILITDLGYGRTHYPEGAHSLLQPGPCQIKALCGRTITRTALAVPIGHVRPNCAAVRRPPQRGTASRPSPRRPAARRWRWLPAQTATSP